MVPTVPRLSSLRVRKDSQIASQFVISVKRQATAIDLQPVDNYRLVIALKIK
jgi:hypothetical protein